VKSVEGLVRKACTEYGMLADGDRIGIGVSGGKDSMSMLAAMAALRRYSEKSYYIEALILDPCFGNVEGDYSAIERYCESIDVPLVIKRTNIGEVVFDIRQEHNPCSLCARLRRGSLHDLCIERGLNKIALGHHKNDAVETLFLNLFNEGRLDAFSPVSYLSRKNLYMIRPMILCEESLLTAYAARISLPIYKNPCPNDGFSKREEIKRFCAEKEAEYPGFLTRTFHAMQRADVSGLAPKFEPDYSRPDKNEDISE